MHSHHLLMLGVKRGAVVFRAMPDGTVTIERKPEEEAEGDPVLDGFLEFLARDMMQKPQPIVPLHRALIDEIDALVGGVDVDLERPLGDD